MPDETATLAVAASAGEGTAPTAVQAGSTHPDAPGSTPPPAGQPHATPAETPDPGQGAAPAPPGLFASMEHAERDYKALQAYSTRMAQAMATLQPYGAPDRIVGDLEALGRLRQDGEFQEWLKSRAAKDAAGSGDPETVKALDLINQIVESRIAEKLAPLQQENTAARMQSVFAKMDQTHPDWRGYMQTMHQRLMAGIQAGRLSPKVLTDFDMDFVEDLYLTTAARDPKWASTKHQARLAETKKIAIPSEPGTAPKAIGPRQASSLAEAFKMAKESLGVV